MSQKLKRKLRRVSARIAPHIGLFGHDVFVDLQKRCPELSIETVVDVGANVGSVALGYSRRFKDARIVALEPSPTTFKTLVERAGGTSVECFNIALGSEQTTLPFLEDPLDSSMSRIVAEGHTNILVPVERLDAFAERHSIHQISFLKIDTEGHELEVLRGAVEMLSKGKVDCIEVECGIATSNAYHTHWTEIVPYLDQFGFSIFGFYEQTAEWIQRKPFLRRCNIVFIKNA